MSITHSYNTQYMHAHVHQCYAEDTFFLRFLSGGRNVTKDHPSASLRLIICFFGNPTTPVERLCFFGNHTTPVTFNFPAGEMRPKIIHGFFGITLRPSMCFFGNHTTPVT